MDESETPRGQLRDDPSLRALYAEFSESMRRMREESAEEAHRVDARATRRFNESMQARKAEHEQLEARRREAEAERRAAEVKTARLRQELEAVKERLRELDCRDGITPS